MTYIYSNGGTAIAVGNDTYPLRILLAGNGRQGERSINNSACSCGILAVYDCVLSARLTGSAMVVVGSIPTRPPSGKVEER